MVPPTLTFPSESFDIEIPAELDTWELKDVRKNLWLFYKDNVVKVWNKKLDRILTTEIENGNNAVQFLVADNGFIYTLNTEKGKAYFFNGETNIDLGVDKGVTFENNKMQIRNTATPIIIYDGADVVTENGKLYLGEIPFNSMFRTSLYSFAVTQNDGLHFIENATSELPGASSTDVNLGEDNYNIKQNKASRVNASAGIPEKELTERGNIKSYNEIIADRYPNFVKQNANLFGKDIIETSNINNAEDVKNFLIDNESILGQLGEDYKYKDVVINNNKKVINAFVKNGGDLSEIGGLELVKFAPQYESEIIDNFLTGSKDKFEAFKEVKETYPDYKGLDKKVNTYVNSLLENSGDKLATAYAIKENAIDLLDNKGAMALRNAFAESINNELSKK
ncbi:unnamed protein product, partial [Cylicocyclus nassatus]